MRSFPSIRKLISLTSTWISSKCSPLEERISGRLVSGKVVLLMVQNGLSALSSGKYNVVLSRNSRFSAPDTEVFASLEQALASCNADEEVFVIGGASVYREAMPFADRLCLTLVDDTPTHADAFFPEILAAEWEIVFDEPHERDDRHAYAYRFVDFERQT